MPPNDVQTPVQDVQPAQTTSPPAPTEVVPTKVNYAGAVFFTLLIVGFTFHLPILLYLPILFFCLVAGIMFFSDALSSRGSPSSAQAPAGGTPVFKPRYHKLAMAVLIVFGVMQAIALLFVGFIALLVVALSSGGGFG